MRSSVWWWVAGGAAGAAAVGYGGYRLLRRNAAAAATPGTTLTVSSASSSRTASVSTPSFLSWSAPQSYSESGFAVIGPGPGNQPNGAYQLAIEFTIPSTRQYVLSVVADDLAILTLDGVTVGYVTGQTSFQANPSTSRSATISLAQGTHQLVVTMWNNYMGIAMKVPYQSGNANPTGLYLQLQSAAGPVIVTTASATGWHYSGYAADLQVVSNQLYTGSLFGQPSAATPGTTPTASSASSSRTASVATSSASSATDNASRQVTASNPASSSAVSVAQYDANPQAGETYTFRSNGRTYQVTPTAAQAAVEQDQLSALKQALQSSNPQVRLVAQQYATDNNLLGY